MNLYAKLLQREESGKPITVGLIGATSKKSSRRLTSQSEQCDISATECQTHAA
jgi:predicted homoserine dehydrogenase-like protein